MDIDELYKRKGQLVTNIEIHQAQLSDVNKQILNFINNNMKERSNGATQVEPSIEMVSE